MMVMTAVISHAPISSAGEPVTRAISAETMKMPEPIMEPTTIEVALKRPRPFTRGASAVVVPGLESLRSGSGLGRHCFLFYRKRRRKSSANFAGDRSG